MSMDKVSKRVIRVDISASIQSFTFEWKQKAQRPANSNFEWICLPFLRWRGGKVDGKARFVVESKKKKGGLIM
jgi:hypothetical protein